MKRFIALGFGAILVVLAPGCSSNDPDSLTKQSISQMNDLATAIEKKEAADKIKSLAEKLKTTIEKLESLKLSDDEKKKLQEKYQKELTEATTKLLTASMANPDGATVMASLGGGAPSSKSQEGIGGKPHGGYGGVGGKK
jgi:hypothetical protein